MHPASCVFMHRFAQSMSDRPYVNISHTNTMSKIYGQRNKNMHVDVAEGLAVLKLLNSLCSRINFSDEILF